MICQLTGRLLRVTDSAAILQAGALAYEVLVPAATIADLQRLDGNEITLFTVHYLDGSLATGNLVPRLVGFLTEPEREFFHLLNKVKGISTRKALRAMSISCHQFAIAIEQGDVRLLTSLPEIGKRTAAQIVTELRGQMQQYVLPSARPLPESELTDAQLVAVDVLVQWGDRRADAQRWVADAVQTDPALTEPEDIIRAAYKAKARS